jgi:hypothetical protein
MTPLLAVEVGHRPQNGGAGSPPPRGHGGAPHAPSGLAIGRLMGDGSVDAARQADTAVGRGPNRRATDAVWSMMVGHLDEYDGLVRLAVERFNDPVRCGEGTR